jgi:hypothetical protein
MGVFLVKIKLLILFIIKMFSVLWLITYPITRLVIGSKFNTWPMLINTVRTKRLKVIVYICNASLFHYMWFKSVFCIQSHLGVLFTKVFRFYVKKKKEYIIFMIYNQDVIKKYLFPTHNHKLAQLKSLKRTQKGARDYFYYVWTTSPYPGN